MFAKQQQRRHFESKEKTAESAGLVYFDKMKWQRRSRVQGLAVVLWFSFPLGCLGCVNYEGSEYLAKKVEGIS